jgi:hypothetical protein
MKAKHKYILTLSTLALFVISVFIGYFIITAVVTKAPLPDGGGCYKECSGKEDCPPCGYKKGRCIEGKCVWDYECEDNGNCIDLACCDKYTSIYKGDCFKGIHSDDKYLCESK